MTEKEKKPGSGPSVEENRRDQGSDSERTSINNQQIKEDDDDDISIPTSRLKNRNE